MVNVEWWGSGARRIGSTVEWSADCAYLSDRTRRALFRKHGKVVVVRLRIGA